jgi:hypothetical protein
LFSLGNQRRKIEEKREKNGLKVVNVLEWWDAFNLKAEGPSLTVLIDWWQLAASSTNHCCQTWQAEAKTRALPSYPVCPNPSKPVDNLKAEDPSLSLYSVDTHNESKKVVSVHRLRLCMKLGLKLYF